MDSEDRRKIVQDLIDNGPTMPHPKWSKETILEHCQEMYEKLEIIKTWIIETLLDRAE